jgi:GNAT superfamily N-acetyltransferase
MQRAMKLFTFREAAASDADAIAGLHTASWRKAYRGILPDSFLDGPIVDERREAWRSRLSSPSPHRQLVLLALHNESPVGFACVLLDEEPVRGACLDNLHVLSGCQGRGIGRQLFARAAQWTRAVEPTWPMHLWVFEENRPAIRFYDALGGKVTGRELRRCGGVDVPALCYVWKDLDALIARANGRRT